MNLATRNRLVAILLAVGLGSLAVAAYSAAELGFFRSATFHGTAYPDTPPAPEFSLTDHRGTRVSLADFRGRAVLLFFGYTRCPDVCPLTLSRLSQVLEDGGFEPDEVTVLLISVDPEHDTPQRIAEYVASFGPHTIGLTGDPSELQNLFGAYGVYAFATEGHDGQSILAHTSQVFGIDAAGRLRVLIHADAPPGIIADDVRLLVEGR